MINSILKKDISFCGFSLFKIKETRSSYKYYIFGIQFKHIKKDGNKIFAEEFFRSGDRTGIKSVQIILNNLGEAVIYARTAPFWLKKCSIVAGTKIGHKDIFKMFAPQIPFCVIQKGNFPLFIKNSFQHNNVHFEPILDDKKLIELNNTRVHFWKNWEQYLNSDFSHLLFPKAIISQKEKQEAKNIMKERYLLENKFIFLIKNATSIESLPDSFWDEIERELKKKGYLIYENLKSIPIPVTYQIASKSDGIVALRCGLCDVLSELRIPQFLIYSHNPEHRDLQDMYTMEKFPWTENCYMHEYNSLYNSLKDIKKNILMKIEPII